MIGVIVETNVLEVTQALELKAKRLSQAVKDTAADLGNRVWLDYQRTASTWVHRPLFTREIETNGDTVTLQVGTEDTIYLFVDKGTAAHFIFPRSPGGTLAFQWGGPGSYRAATRPGILGSRTHGASGPGIFRRYVEHPGTAARRFSETIQAKYDRMADEIATKHIREWQNA
jgi:hypothetical protein